MRNVVSAMLVACVVSVGIGLAAQGEPATQSQQPATQSAPPAAQNPQPAAESQQPGPEAQAPAEQRRQPAPAAPRAADKVTISGCIQNAPASSADAAASSKFVLAKGKMAGGAAGSSSAVGTSGITSAGTQYRLDGDEKALSPHLNHQVEITGTVQNTSASATGAANAAPGSAAAGPTLKVDSVKMVSAKCE
jgi:hypothetical protein